MSLAFESKILVKLIAALFGKRIVFGYVYWILLRCVCAKSHFEMEEHCLLLFSGFE